MQQASNQVTGSTKVCMHSAISKMRQTAGSSRHVLAATRAVGAFLAAVRTNHGSRLDFNGVDRSKCRARRMAQISCRTSVILQASLCQEPNSLSKLNYETPCGNDTTLRKVLHDELPKLTHTTVAAKAQQRFTSSLVYLRVNQIVTTPPNKMHLNELYTNTAD
jgi:hypothetical protein